MITIKLMGGLGNQMSQLAAGLAPKIWLTEGRGDASGLLPERWVKL